MSDSPDSPPPDYFEAVGSSTQGRGASGSRTPPRDEPRSSTPRTSASYGFPDEKRSPQTLYSPAQALAGPSTPRASSSKSASWIPDLWSWRAEARTDAEVKKTVQSLIKDVIVDPSRADTLPILQSCLAACRARHISFEDLIQRPFIDGHTPLYWAILGSRKRRPENTTLEEPHSVIDFLVSFPLSDRTTLDACQACMLNSDNVLFQRLRLSPGFSRTSYTDTIVTGGGSPNEPVHVEHVPNAGPGEFTISLTISRWIPRMRVAKGVAVDFVARGRGWRLEFTVAKEHDLMNELQPGTWCAVLQLLKGSEPTPVSARLTIPPARSRNGSEAIEPIEIGFQTKRRMKLSPDTRDLEQVDKIVTRLDSLPRGSSLEFEDSPYVDEQGSISVTGQFILESTGGTDCVIM